MTIGIITLENQTDRAATIGVLREWAQVAQVHLDIRTVPETLKGREAGALMLGMLAPHILQRSPGRVLVISNSWMSARQHANMGTARVRMLERASLAHGVYPVLHDFEPTRLMEVLCEQHRRKSGIAPETAPGSGAWRPGASVLMVGDRPNTAKHGSLKYRLPFVSMYPTGHGVDLTEHLEYWHIQERHLYWVNSEDCAGERTDPKFVEQLAPRAIITLGKVAEKWCANYGLNSRAIPHPRYMNLHGLPISRDPNSFRDHNSYPLGRLLHKLLKE